MKLGVVLAYEPWVSLGEQVRLAKLADAVGLDSVWVSEAYGHDVVSVLALLAAHTERVALGTGLMQIPARKPTAAAMAAAGLDAVSDGRLRLGLGVSGPQVSEGWYGVPFGNSLARTRDYVDVVRRALRGDAVEMRLDPGAATGLSKPVRMLVKPVQPTIPIYLGAMGDRATAQCYEIGDGWFPFPVGLDMLSKYPRPANRPFDVSPAVPLAIADTREEARNAVRPWLTFYLGAMGHATMNFLVELAERNGYGAAAREVQLRYRGGGAQAVGEALDDALIDAMSIAVTPRGLESRVSQFEVAGATSLVGIVCGDRDRAVRSLGVLASTA